MKYSGFESFTLDLRSLIFLVVVIAQARADSLSLAVNETGRLELGWELLPVAPFAENPFTVTFEIQRSRRLGQWEAITTGEIGSQGELVRGALQLTNDSAGEFFRIVRFVGEGDLQLSGEDLSRSQFSGVDLVGRDLMFTLLDEANLSEADLRGSDLFKASGDNVRLRRADLTGANLSSAQFVASNFVEVEMVGATARFSSFIESRFSGADLRLVDFTGSDLFSVDLSGADLRGAVFTDSDLTFARLHGSRIDHLSRLPSSVQLAWEIVNEGRPESVLDEVDLTGMILTESNLRGASLQGAVLTAVDFRGADLRGVDLRGAEMALVDLAGSMIDEQTRLPLAQRIVWEILNEPKDDRVLDGVRLIEAVLTGAHLRGASLVGAELAGSVLIGVDLQHADLRRANLRDTFLQNADLRFANLEGAFLTRASLTGAIFEETVMPDGSIRSSE